MHTPDGHTRRHTVLCAVLCLLSCREQKPPDYCPVGLAPCDDGCCVLCLTEGDCSPGEVCCQGQCATTCGGCGSAAFCAHDSQCHDLNGEMLNCGACDQSCSDSHGDTVDACQAGACVCTATAAPCSDGTICCADGCFVSDWSHSHCGDCVNECSSGQVCVSGECLTDEAGVCGTRERCDVGGEPECVDSSTDLDHCGDCDTDCAASYGHQIDACVSGQCVCAALGTGPCLIDEVCGSDGCGPMPCEAALCVGRCCAGDHCVTSSYRGCGDAAGACVDCETEWGTSADACSVDGACVCAASARLCDASE